MESKSTAGHSDSWLIRVKEKLGQVREAKKEDSIQCKAASIYKIPHHLRDGDAHTPQLVSLGPYHHGRSHLHSMEEHKWMALDCALHRHDQQIETYINAIKEVEERARACYQEPLSQSSNEFVEMMFLDACFVLEMLRFAVCRMGYLGYSGTDPFLSNCGTMKTIRRDMMLLENQVPLYILDKLLCIQEGPDKNITRLVLHFFQPVMWIDDWNKQQQLDGLHCLDVLWRSLLVFKAEAKSTPHPWIIKCWNRSHSLSDHGQQMSIPCAIKLRDAGIKFKIRYTPVLSDIAFGNGILNVPPLLIDNRTELFFLNLIAYETCADNNMYYANSYMVFMSDLIKSADDVRCLKRCGIIHNQLKSDDEVAKMFDRLGQKANVGINYSSLNKVSTNVNDYAKTSGRGCSAIKCTSIG